MSDPEVRTDHGLETVGALGTGEVSSVVGRVLKWVLTLGFFGVVSASALGAWRFSDLFYQDALLPPFTLPEPVYGDGLVVSVTNDRITLQIAETATPSIRQEGLYGIQWPGGHGQVGEIMEADTSMVVRKFVAVEGAPRPGDEVSVNGTRYYDDPLSDLGIDFADVDVRTELGDAPAWYVEGDSNTWVIFVHGKGVERTEALRALPSFVDNGHPALVITYRNDAGLEPDRSGIYQFGLTEWRDLEAGVQWVLNQGAQRVILFGYSMGGAITIEFMHRSSLNDRVAGLVLDAPMLDLGRIVDRNARDQGIPAMLASASKTVAAMRFGLNWSEMNYLAKLDRIAVPVLLFHGSDDRRVPIELSEDLAAALPELVTYLPVENAGHVESWNVDRGAYEAALQDVMDQVAALTATGE